MLKKELNLKTLKPNKGKKMKTVIIKIPMIGLMTFSVILGCFSSIFDSLIKIALRLYFWLEGKTTIRV